MQDVLLCAVALHAQVKNRNPKERCGIWHRIKLLDQLRDWYWSCWYWNSNNNGTDSLHRSPGLLKKNPMQCPHREVDYRNGDRGEDDELGTSMRGRTRRHQATTFHCRNAAVLWIDPKRQPTTNSSANKSTTEPLRLCNCGSALLDRRGQGLRRTGLDRTCRTRRKGLHSVWAVLDGYSVPLITSGSRSSNFRFREPSVPGNSKISNKRRFSWRSRWFSSS